MPDLKSLEGGTITAIIRSFDSQTAQSYKLHKIEEYGIWIESQTYTEKLLATAGSSSARRSLVLPERDR